MCVCVLFAFAEESVRILFLYSARTRQKVHSDEEKGGRECVSWEMFCVCLWRQESEWIKLPRVAVAWVKTRWRVLKVTWSQEERGEKEKGWEDEVGKDKRKWGKKIQKLPKAFSCRVGWLVSTFALSLCPRDATGAGIFSCLSVCIFLHNREGDDEERQKLRKKQEEERWENFDVQYANEWKTTGQGTNNASIFKLKWTLRPRMHCLLFFALSLSSHSY